jgi:hypothetical protein
MSGATCAGPGCGASLEGGPANRRFCSERCRKAAYRSRTRASRPVPARTARARRQPPEQVAADGEAFLRALERETLVSLKRDPSRWRHTRAADPDHHRAKPRRGRGTRAAS